MNAQDHPQDLLKDEWWMIKIIHKIYWRMNDEDEWLWLWLSIRFIEKWMIKIIEDEWLRSIRFIVRWIMKIIHEIYWRWMIKIIEDE